MMWNINMRDLFKTSLHDIKQGFHGLKQIAKQNFRVGNYDLAMKYIDYCVRVASQFNWTYSDEELEDLLAKVARIVIKNDDLESYQADDNNWVFFDDYCTSYVLALQWMTALTKLQKRILYITTQDPGVKRRDKSILSEIEKMPNVSVEVVPSGGFFDRANYLYNSIIGFKPSKVVLHKAMNSLIQLPLCVLPKEIEKYNINLGDQFFWLGSKSIDYNIEFRPFGASVSLQYRGFRKEQLLMVPFYPVNDNRPFEGFPFKNEDKIVIFSGGDCYKVWDEKGTFWRLVKKILDKHKNVVFYFVTKNNASGVMGIESIRKFICENHFENRFFCSKFRYDIYQVFSHCDIYMGTCPISGSLMSQLAAANGKPILQYYPPGTPDDETEQAIGINEKFKVSFTYESEFLEEADKLISDFEYRKKQGLRLQAAMMQPGQFDKLVADTMMTNVSQYDLEPFRIDNKFLEKRWLALEKVGFTNVSSYLASILGKKCLKYAPLLYFKKRFSQVQNIRKVE